MSYPSPQILIPMIDGMKMATCKANTDATEHRSECTLRMIFLGTGLARSFGARPAQGPSKHLGIVLDLLHLSIALTVLSNPKLHETPERQFTGVYEKIYFFSDCRCGNRFALT